MALSTYKFISRSELEGNTLYGTAIVFDTPTLLPNGQYEMVSRSAVAELMESGETDVRALYQHDEKQPLGSESQGTLKLDLTKRGVEYAVDLPNTSYADDLKDLVERGEIRGSSFSALPAESDLIRRGSTFTRVHTKFSVFRDISPVTFPAYKETSAMLRSEQPENASNRALLASARWRTLNKLRTE